MNKGKWRRDPWARPGAKGYRAKRPARGRIPLAFRPAQKGAGWKRYVPLWLGAALVGLLIGAGPQFAAREGSRPQGWSEQPIAWNEVQPVRRAALDSGESTWLERALDLPGGKGPSATEQLKRHFSLCFTGGGHDCVVDGDTIWFDGTKVRIADIDAPETHEPACAFEKQLGDKATLRLQQYLNSGTVSLASSGRDEDRYGRKLRIVLVDGENAGEMLVAEGLARPYGSGRQPWC